MTPPPPRKMAHIAQKSTLNNKHVVDSPYSFVTFVLMLSFFTYHITCLNKYL